MVSYNSSSPSASTYRLLQRVSTASQYVTFSDYPTSIRMLSCIGGCFMGRFLFKLGIFLWNHCVPYRRPVDYFEKRYGIGSWVVITGATGSIGSAFCSFFADRSFNLVLIGRSLEGLEAKSKELKDAYPTVMTKLVVTDFARSAEEGWIDTIVEQLQGMSISVLVNADRWETTNASKTVTHVESIRRTLIVNDFPVVLLTSKLLPRLAERYEKLKLRGAIITVSSDAGKRIFPGFTIYGASMALANYFTVAAGVEFQHAVDSLCINLVGGENCGGRHNPHRYVFSSMRQLGRGRETSGWWLHSLQLGLLNLIPSEILYLVWPRIAKIKRLSHQDD